MKDAAYTHSLRLQIEEEEEEIDIKVDDVI